MVESEMMRKKLVLVLVLLVVVLMVNGIRSDVEKDREKCANDLVGLATCLPYVSGEAKSPPIDCCNGLKVVLHNSPQCICLLVKDRNDPSLGLKINATLALSLPSHCHSPANVTDCPALLHLPPNSPDAKVFQDFAKNGNKSSNATATAPSANSSTATEEAAGDVKNHGGERKSCWLGLGLFLTTTVGVGVFTL